MLVPYRTTTPLYYMPWCTLALIGVNCAVFFAELHFLSPGEIEALCLAHGDGIHPVQWLTSSFVHASLGHLIGNMIFLWVFGQITEGRLGWTRFLVAYLGIGVVQNGAEQILLLGADPGGSLGASSVIFGLMAMALLWAPEEEIYIFYWFFIVFGTFALRVKTLAFLYVVEQAFFAWAWASLGAGISSALLHLMGAAVGLVPGIILLRKGWMEIDGKDAFTVYGIPIGPKEKTVDDGRRPPPGAEADPQTMRRLRALEELRGHLQAGDPTAALAVYRRNATTGGAWPLPEGDLHDLIRALARAKRWADVRPLLVQYVRRYPETCAPMQLLLGRIYLEVEGSPSRAIRVLDSMSASGLGGKLWEARQRLIEKARAARAQAR